MAEPHSFIRILIRGAEVSIEVKEIGHNLRAGFQVFKEVFHLMLGLAIRLVFHLLAVRFVERQIIHLQNVVTD